MNDETIKSMITEAYQIIQTLPKAKRGPLLGLLEQLSIRNDKVNDNLVNQNKELAEWRLLMKYLMFDLESTRRERDELLNRLNEI